MEQYENLGAFLEENVNTTTKDDEEQQYYNYMAEYVQLILFDTMSA